LLPGQRLASHLKQVQFGVCAAARSILTAGFLAFQGVLRDIQDTLEDGMNVKQSAESGWWAAGQGKEGQKNIVDANDALA
jgi:hypothetical protein